MKKSQLRKIIRESIKELVSRKKLIKEQATQVPNAMQVALISCGAYGTTYSSAWSLTVNGQAPQEGDIIMADFCNMGGTNIGTYFVSEVLGPGDVTQNPNVGDNGHVYATGAQGTYDSTSWDPQNYQNEPIPFCARCIPNYVNPNGSGMPSYYLPPSGCQDVPGGYDANVIANGCNPGGVSLPVLGCTDPNSASCDSNANQDDGSCGSSFIPDINAFMNSFGCHDPSATNYQPYIQPPGPIGGMFDVSIPNNFPNQTYSGPGCMVYNMMTTDCGTQIVDFTQAFPAGGYIQDTSCCTYGPPPTPLVAGCTVVQSLNYDATADGCPDANGVVDVNDISCCTQTQSGGAVTPTGQQSADNLTLQVADPITPTPNPSDPQMKRMKDLAFRGKRKK